VNCLSESESESLSCIILTHETKYASSTMKVVDLLALRVGSSNLQDPLATGLCTVAVPEIEVWGAVAQQGVCPGAEPLVGG